MKKNLLILCALLLTSIGANAQEVATAYTFSAENWVALDDHTGTSLTYGDDGKTITVTYTGTEAGIGNMGTMAETGANTASYTVTNEQYWFVIVGTGLSTEKSHALWWMNGYNGYGLTAYPTEVVTLEDNSVALVWDLRIADSGGRVPNTNLQNDTNTLSGGTCFGLISETGSFTISDICFYTTEEAVEAYPELEGTLTDTKPYEFVCTDWVALDDHSGTTVTPNIDGNTISVSYSTGTEAGLGNMGTMAETGANTASYYVTKEQHWFVIKGTGLSTSGNMLWWMNYKNDGTWSPTEVATLSDGSVILAWDLSEGTLAMTGEKNTLSGGTCFGLIADNSTTGFTITDIGFYTEEEIDDMIAAEPYTFVAKEWVSLDLSRVTAANITYDDDANTITVAAGTGNNNVALSNSTTNDSKYGPISTAYKYVTTEQKWFVVIGTNLSTASGASYLWWLNGLNDSGSYSPDKTETLADGRILFAWDLSSSTLSGINSNLLDDEINHLDGLTGFGLTSSTGTSVISDINFYTEDELTAIIEGDAHFCEANASHWTLTQAGSGTNGALQRDTWATQNDEDMSVPFMEYYVPEGTNKDVTLSAATISHEQLTLEPGLYKVSMDIRIIEYDTGSINDGTKFKANDVEEDLLDGVDANDGIYSADNAEDLFGTYTLYVVITEDNTTLDISLVIPEGANYSWIMWKNLTVTRLDDDATPVTVEGTMGAEYGTLILPFAATLDETTASGITAYTAGSVTTVEGESVLTLTDAGNSLTAGTPYIIGGSTGSETYKFSGVPTKYEVSYTDGLLTGTFVDMTQDDFTADGTQYVLQNHTGDDGLAFYPITSSSTGVTLSAYHCYLTYSGANPVRGFISFPDSDEATAIMAVEGAEAEGNGAIYDLSGRRVAKAVKGVYIQNGKKVLVK